MFRSQPDKHNVPFDGGGVHLNATVLGHAFYLAIEGGRNTTSGVAVQGVALVHESELARNDANPQVLH